MSEEDFVAEGTSRRKEAQLQKADIVEYLAAQFQRLPENDRKLVMYGSFFLGLNGAFTGLIANSLYRRILHVMQARFASSLPMAFLPFLTTVAMYSGVVTQPLLQGDLNCSICTVIRGGLIGSLVGGLYPIILALPINGGLAARYQTSPLPTKGNVMRFWMKVSEPVLRKMSYVLILQGMFGAYMSSRHFMIYEKMLHLPPPDKFTQ